MTDPLQSYVGVVEATRRETPEEYRFIQHVAAWK